MFRMKRASMGEMPPNTRRTAGRSAVTASAARLTMRAYALQSGSSSKFQCERLFGSFHSITASTTRSPPAHVDLFLGMIGDRKARTTQHRLRAGAIGNPPVGGIVRVRALHEVHSGIAL